MSAASIMYTLLGLTSTVQLCPERPEISPCTCQLSGQVEVRCGQMYNFSTVFQSLQGKFSPNVSISLWITHSDMPDLDMWYFQDLGMPLEQLRLQMNNHTSVLPSHTFEGLDQLKLLTVTDARMTAAPTDILKRLPALRTLSLAQNRIVDVVKSNFQANNNLQYLILSNNEIRHLDPESFPTSLKHLMLSRNKLDSLNGTVKALSQLEWLYVNENNLRTLDGELPLGAPVSILNISSNIIEELPKEMASYTSLEHFDAQNNVIRKIGDALANLTTLRTMNLSLNRLDSISDNELEGLDVLQTLDLRANQIISVSPNFLRHLRSVKKVYLSSNRLEHFSFQSISHLRSIKELDLSNNQLKTLDALTEIEDNPFGVPLRDLHLENNYLTSLNGALQNLDHLQSINLSNNMIETLSPNDLKNLSYLRVLDLSHNKLTSMSFLAAVQLSSLQVLDLNNNKIMDFSVQYEFMPSLCRIDLSSNLVATMVGPYVARSICATEDDDDVHVQLEGNPISCALTAGLDGVVLLGIPACAENATAVDPVINQINDDDDT